MIEYEYPLNERVRTWLRLEDLFDKAFFFIRAGDARSHHAALLALFELVDVMARPELRSELLQELERQKILLDGLRGNPAVAVDRLEPLIERMSAVLGQLHAQTGKLGQHVRDNEWLSGIKSRAGIPGGTCGFDLPGYYHWLNSPPDRRAADLRAWLEPLQPIRNGVLLVMDLLRESSQGVGYVAVSGIFQLMLGGRVAQMLRVGLAREWPCVPEVSANKYAVNLRFVTVDKNQKARTFDQDVPFELQLCSLIGGNPSS